jgi:hypothetical protein
LQAILDELGTRTSTWTDSPNESPVQPRHRDLPRRIESARIEVDRIILDVADDAGSG